MSSIPIIDLAQIELIDNATENEDWICTAEKIRDGLGDVGFLYLINHGIPEKLVLEAFENTKRFFNLPVETKLKYKKDAGNKNELKEFYNNFYGYTAVGQESLNQKAGFDMKEVFDWIDRATDAIPDSELPGFKEIILELDAQCKILMKKLLKLMAMALKLDVDFFLRQCQHLDEPMKHPGIHVGKLNHYLPISDNSHSIRCGEHTDYVFLTLLFQDSVGGLEVKHVDGTWMNATPIPGSIIINAGDLTEFWTSGIFPATPHRVITSTDCDDEKKNKSRYSIAVFCGPDNDVLVTPLDLEKRPAELKRLETNGKKYSTEPINAYDYVMRRCANHTY